MEAGFRPTPGQVVLLEYDTGGGAGPAADRHTVTGLILRTEGGQVTISLTPTVSPPLDGTDVLASVFAPDALFRAHGTAHLPCPGRLRLYAIRDVERIQRRSWPRRSLALDVRLVPLDDVDLDDVAMVAVAGRTVDLGIGGARVRTMDRLPVGVDPSLALTLPDGTDMLLAARIVYADVCDTGCDYRLAFCDLDESDAARLAELVGSPAA